MPKQPAIKLTPAGQPMPDLSSYNYSVPEQSLASAYCQGCCAYYLGQPQSDNPHLGGRVKVWAEWDRGYRIARQRDRFNATIAKRREAVS